MNPAPSSCSAPIPTTATSPAPQLIATTTAGHRGTDDAADLEHDPRAA